MPQTSFDKANVKVVLFEGVHALAEERFRADGYTNVTNVSTALPAGDVPDLVGDAHVLGIRSRSQLTAPVLEAAGKLMAIGCFCIGTNQVDLGAARLRGVPVFNAPYSNTRSVAELVLAEAVLLLRGIPAKDGLLKQGVWKKSASNAFEIRGKTLGVIGYGNIGSQLGVMAESLGMNVVFYDIVKKLKLGNARQVDTLEELLAMANVVTLHVPATPETAGMIGAAQLDTMKPSSVLINASRGNVVDLDALGAALRGGSILGAAIDVYPEEPASNDLGDDFATPMHGCDNVILTPHIGGSTLEAQENIAVEVAEKVIRYSDNGSTRSAVNFPEVALPGHAGKHRLLHIHRNEPGVMSQINAAIAESGVNIASQYLETRADVGYVVMDVDTEYSTTALEKLKTIDATIRTRVLF